MLSRMRVVPVLAVMTPLWLVGLTAHADALPEPDPYMACEQRELGSPCFSELGGGYCVEADCPDDPAKKCGYCDPNATATTGADTAATTGSDTAPTTGATAGGTTAGGTTAGSPDPGTSGTTSDDNGGTSDGTSPKKNADGCGCRSDASPAGALALLGLLGLARRRRR